MRRLRVGSFYCAEALDLITVERLQPERWGDLVRAFAAGRSDEPLPDVRHGAVFAASDGDRLVGLMAAEKVWCGSGLFVEPEYLGRGLPQLLAESARSVNVEGLREVCVTTNRHVELMVYRLGYRPLEGVLWRCER